MSKGKAVNPAAKGPKNQKLGSSRSGSSPARILLALGGGAILLMAVLWLATGRPGLDAPASKPKGDFPSFAYNSSVTLIGYQSAASHPNDLNWMPCYCGCAQEGHISLRDCFYKPDGAYNDHASNCHICAEIATDMAKGLDGGRSLKEVRAAIDAKFGGQGGGTRTPPVT